MCLIISIITLIISIHALLAESDSRLLRRFLNMSSFLSTLSLRRATKRYFTCFIGRLLISIHALLAESDRKKSPLTCIIKHFYPRSPCGERLFGRRNRKLILIFLSTLSLRRATSKTVRRIWRMLHFYPRSPCGERQLVLSLLEQLRHFYPRSPCGERHGPMKKGQVYYIISIHALLAESDT